MATEIQQILADAFVCALTDWQINNLSVHMGCRFCCGKTAWRFWSPPDRYSPEVVANCEELPVLTDKQDMFPEAWGMTFRRLCQVSGVVRNCYHAWLSNRLGDPLTFYGFAIEAAKTDDIRKAIRIATHIRLGRSISGCCQHSGLSGGHAWRKD